MGKSMVICNWISLRGYLMQGMAETMIVLSVRVYGSVHVGSIRNGFDDFICSAVERMD